MQNIVIDTPYRFRPPFRTTFWARLLAPYVPRYLRRSFGVERFEFRGTRHLVQSYAAKHGIILAPNHCRPEDPFTMGMLCKELGIPLYFMAARHLFDAGRAKALLLRMIGAFSVHREGMDRDSMNFTIETLTHADRPVVLFAEGTITRSNDRLVEMMDGVTLMARRAAVNRVKINPQAKVVIHPIALRYVFDGDWRMAIEGVLADVERRLAWRPQTQLPILERICKVGDALLTLKEFEYLGNRQPGGIETRQTALVEHLFRPLEVEWLNGKREADVVQRVKRLRTEILADMLAGKVDAVERARRWKQLADIYLAQQITFYPPGYLDGNPSPERMLETVERFEEDLTDAQRVHRPYRVIVQIGEAIEVGPERARGRTGDPIMAKVKARLESMLADLTREVAQQRKAREVLDSERSGTTP